MNGRPWTALTAVSPQMLKASDTPLYAIKPPIYLTTHLCNSFYNVTFSFYLSHISEFISKEIKQPNTEMTCLKPK